MTTAQFIFVKFMVVRCDVVLALMSVLLNNNIKKEENKHRRDSNSICSVLFYKLIPYAALLSVMMNQSSAAERAKG